MDAQTPRIVQEQRHFAAMCSNVRLRSKVDRDRIWEVLVAVTDQSARTLQIEQMVFSGLARFVNPNDLRRLGYEDYLANVPAAVLENFREIDDGTIRTVTEPYEGFWLAMDGALNREVLSLIISQTGQNFDYELNQVFFDDLEIRKPDHFLGAAGTVTGSRYSITYGDRHLMVDCGMFQGDLEITERNRDAWPVKAHQYEALLLTHAHIDHSGCIPKLVADGFNGPILCTEPTIELCELLLPDSAKIMRSEGDPLFSDEDAQAALALMEGCRYYKQYEACEGVGVTFFDAGHIVGSAWLELEFDPLPSWPDQRPVQLVFSGDLGRGLGPMLAAPDRPERADFLVLESTYGGHLHGSLPFREVRHRHTHANFGKKLAQA
jgi:ribonuclease BN (tRNA processing enzyme)